MYFVHTNSILLSQLHISTQICSVSNRKDLPYSVLQNNYHLPKHIPQDPVWSKTLSRFIHILAFCGPAQQTPIPKEGKAHFPAFRWIPMPTWSISHHFVKQHNIQQEILILSRAHTTWTALSTQDSREVRGRRMKKREKVIQGNKTKMQIITLTTHCEERKIMHGEGKSITEISWIMINIYNDLATSDSIFCINTRSAHILTLLQMTSHHNSTKPVFTANLLLTPQKTLVYGATDPVLSWYL